MYRFEVPCRAIGTQMIRDEGRRVDLAPVPGSAQQDTTGLMARFKITLAKKACLLISKAPAAKRAATSKPLMVLACPPPVALLRHYNHIAFQMTTFKGGGHQPCTRT